MISEILLEYLNNSQIEYLLGQKMSDYTTFKIGGTADCMCFPKTQDEIKGLLRFCNQNNVPYFCLGNGSNLLVSDEGVDGVVISLKYFDKIELKSPLEITCGVGIKLSKLCTFALENSLSGLEFAWGIPGTVGGAIYMNAGAYNGEIKNVLTECTYIDGEGNVIQADVSSLELGYRKSTFQNSNSIIISAKFKLVLEDKNIIKAQMDDLILRRKTKQPLEYPSAGSTFKRPSGYYASALIEECGLKGVSVGGAMVSEKHSGFVINTGNATCSDVLLLVQKIKEEVFLQKSVNLEMEVKYIGRK